MSLSIENMATKPFINFCLWFLNEKNTTTIFSESLLNKFISYYKRFLSKKIVYLDDKWKGDNDLVSFLSLLSFYLVLQKRNSIIIIVEDVKKSAIKERFKDFIFAYFEKHRPIIKGKELIFSNGSKVCFFSPTNYLIRNYDRKINLVVFYEVNIKNEKKLLFDIELLEEKKNNIENLILLVDNKLELEKT